MMDLYFPSPTFRSAVRQYRILLRLTGTRSQSIPLFGAGGRSEWE